MRMEDVFFKRLVIGHCPCCERTTLFVSRDYWLRDNYRCVRCKSIPRFRSLYHELRKRFPSDGADRLFIHEASPGPAEFAWMKNYPNCSWSYYYEDRPLGEQLGRPDVTNQNLCKMTFPDDSFDVFITQDVMEHIDRPMDALKEIERVLKPGGVHIFTTPIYIFSKTHPRISFNEKGERIYVDPPVYHGNPISSEGSLVTYDWGDDILDYIDGSAGFVSEIITYPNSRENYRMGLEADYLYVVISRKRS